MTTSTNAASFALLALFAAGCVGPWPGTTDTGPTEPTGPVPLLEEARVAFVFPGPVGDHGWSFAHNEGRLYLADDAGVETTFEELVSPADLATVVQDFEDRGYNTVVTASADYISGTQQAADDHPDMYFLVCGGQVSQTNLTSYFGRIYQPIYLSGFLAGSLSETDRVGIVAAKPLPEFVRHINAFTLGARAANPRVVVDVRWIDAFFDPVLEEQYTNELLDLGADVILTQTDSTIPVEQVELRARDGERVMSIGYDNEDGCAAGPNSCVTSAYWNWGPYYVDRVTSLVQGTWAPDDIEWQPFTNDDDSVVGLADTSPALVPGAVREELAVAKNDLQADPARPFVGPLADNTGKNRLGSGESMTDLELDRICWYVDGVIDSTSGADLPAVVQSECQGDH